MRSMQAAKQTCMENIVSEAEEAARRQHLKTVCELTNNR